MNERLNKEGSVAMANTETMQRESIGHVCTGATRVMVTCYLCKRECDLFWIHSMEYGASFPICGKCSKQIESRLNSKG